MSGMLGRAPANVPALVARGEVFVSGDASKRFCKAWPRGVDLLIEPTSVLDIRSPSPSSTLSSSLGGSSESGVQGSSESGGAVAVSGLFYEGTSEKQLPDCTSLLEGGGEVRSVWGVEAGENGGAGNDYVGTWQASTGSMHRGGEKCLAPRQDADCKHVDGTPSLIKGVVAGLLPGGNVGTPLNPGFMQVLSMAQEKQGQGGGEALRKPEPFNIAPSIRVGKAENVTEKLVKHEVAVADESLQACVMSCRKRDREDSLGEVVQRGGVGGQKFEAREWVADWNDLGEHVSAVAVEEKVTLGQLEDLDDIFSGSPTPPSPGEFWPGESLPLLRDQVSCYAGAEASRGDNVSHGNLPSTSCVQLDLFEAVQAGLLNRGGSNIAGSSSSVSSGALSSPPPRPPNVQPSGQALSHSHSAPFTSSLHQPFSPGGPQMPFHRHLMGGSALLFGTPFTPDFLDARPHAPTSALLSATLAPAPPQFSTQLQFHDLAFPLPVCKNAPAPHGHFLGLPRPEYRNPKAEFADSKPWQMQVVEGDAAPNVVPGGPKWQLKPEPGWIPVERLSPGHVRMPALSHQQSILAEQPLRRQAIMPEVIGQRVRLEELSLAERLLSAASEAARLGDYVSVQAILARLNQQNSSRGQQQQHQQLLPSQHVTLLFTEALAKYIMAGSSTFTPSTFQLNSPLDLISKISAYKSFCEVSPISQFAHFTANQAILDAMEGEDSVHLVDFELGFGGQWASFMQEISQRGRGPPELKITTIGMDTLEMRLAKENLLQFAKEVGMKLQINVVPVQKLEGMKASMVNKGEEEAVAVNFGFGLSRLMVEFSSSTETVLNFLQMVKGLSPKVVAAVDSECEFEGTSGYMGAMQFYACVFESLEACTKLPQEVVENIEGLVFGPKIAEVVSARCARKGSGGGGSGGESGCSSVNSSLPPWRILLQKVGFSALPFSSAAESQAGWLVKNPLNSGFTFLKQHSTLHLGWYNKSLVSASAWV